MRFKMLKKRKQDFFYSMPEASERTLFAINCFYKMLREREYLSGTISIPLPLKDAIIENYLMKNISEYDIIDVKEIIIACDEEYLHINNEAIKQKIK